MNYHQYYPTDVLNGEGVRCVLFLSGCNHGCHGCYNESTWNPNSGFPVTKELEDQIIADLQDERINRQGITLTGGDPLHERNLEAVINLILRIRIECPGKDIWLWTGYTLEELELDYSSVGLLRWIATRKVDVLVDGKFVQALHHPMLKWRGSENQKVLKFVDGVVVDITPNDLRISIKEITNANSQEGCPLSMG